MQYTGVNRTPRQVQSRFQRMKKRIFTDLDGETSPSRGSPPKKLAKMETQKEEKEKNGYSSSEGQIENLKLKLEDKQEKIIKLKKQISEYKKKLDHNTLEIENQRKEIERLKSSDTLNEFKQQYQSIIKQFVTENAKSQLEIKKNKIWEDSIRLGSELICPTNTYFMGGEWQPGASFQQLEIKRLQLEQKKQTIKDKKKEILKEKAQLKTKMSSQGISAPITTPQYVEKLEALTFVEENLRYQLTTIKKEINQLLNTKEQLTLEFQIHSKHVRLISAQEISKFKDHPVLKDRYVLQNLLGRGGFSEVYAAYDLEKHQIVACKIHQLDENWTENKKSNYLKHAIREYSIHKIVNNERVVRLYDVFEIHSSCFCTILEYCPDGDLDWRLKCKKYFSEKEARCIMVQIIEGLRYLSTLDKPVIHYDLKPGNILFNNREVKLTDFGLSKILESPSSTVDLTSQGTGTYWYLPPECFCRDPKISSKVCFPSSSFPFPFFAFSFLSFSRLSSFLPPLFRLPFLCFRSSLSFSFILPSTALLPLSLLCTLLHFLFFQDHNALPFPPFILASVLTKNLPPILSIPSFFPKKSNSDTAIAYINRCISASSHLISFQHSALYGY